MNAAKSLTLRKTWHFCSIANGSVGKFQFGSAEALIRPFRRSFFDALGDEVIYLFSKWMLPKHTVEHRKNLGEEAKRLNPMLLSAPPDRSVRCASFTLYEEPMWSDDDRTTVHYLSSVGRSCVGLC